MTAVLRRYAALGSATLQQQLAYRGLFLITVVGQLMFLGSQYYLWRVLYATRPTLGGFTWAEMQNYLLLTFLANAVVTLNSELFISYRILDGSVAIDLLKPLDYQTARFVETLATAVFEGTTALVVVALLATGFQIAFVPATPLLGVLAAISFALGVVIKFGVVYLAGMACFWTTNGWGISWAQTAVTQLFSGALVPLALLPGWLRTAAEWLPFQATVYAPINVFLGHVDARGAGAVLLGQLGWAVGLWVLGRITWSVMMRKVTIHGG